MMAFDRSQNGDSDAFVTKLNAMGSNLVYSTFLGGAGDDAGNGIFVAGDIASIIGRTRSATFPTTPGAADETYNMGAYGDVFVAQLNSAGSNPVFSTFLGGSGSEAGQDIVLDSAGLIHVTGVTDSTNFPLSNATQNANGGMFDAFVTELNTSGSSIVFSTYIGGANNDAGTGIGLDSTGTTYISGYSWSNNFPTKPTMGPMRVYQPSSSGGGSDAVVVKLSF
jgi:hypothetical protein